MSKKKLVMPLLFVIAAGLLAGGILAKIDGLLYAGVILLIISILLWKFIIRLMK